MSDSTTTTATPSPVKPVERAAGTLDELSGAPKKSRILGVDATRGLALLGMIAVHVYFQAFTSTDTPPPAWMLAWAGGRGTHCDHLHLGSRGQLGAHDAFFAALTAAQRRL